MVGGIAVNNSIILVDRINQLSQAGMELTDAIGRSRTATYPSYHNDYVDYDSGYASNDIRIW